MGESQEVFIGLKNDIPTDHPPFFCSTSYTSNEQLSWLPPTYSAVALRLATLDASLLYDPPSGCTGRDLMAGYLYVLRPPILASDKTKPQTLRVGLDAANLTAPVAAFGRIKPLQLLPHLPASFMSLSQKEFSPPSWDKLHISVDQTVEVEAENVQLSWTLRPAPLRPTQFSGKGKGSVGRSAACATAKGKGSKKGGVSKSKVKKKSALAKSFEAADSDKDYGEMETGNAMTGDDVQYCII